MNFDYILQIGAGGTGAVLAPLLARLAHYHESLPGTMTIADGDTYETHNANRQPIGASHVGTNKASHLLNVLPSQGLNNIAAFPDYVNRRTLEELIKDRQSCLIVCAVDNNATRKATLEVLELSDCDFLWVSPANADNADGSSPIKGQVLWYGRKGARQLGVNPAELYTEISSPNGPIPRKGSCAAQAPSHPQLLAANALAAAWTMSVIQNALDGRLPDEKHALFFDARQMRFALA